MQAIYLYDNNNNIHHLAKQLARSELASILFLNLAGYRLRNLRVQIFLFLKRAGDLCIISLIREERNTRVEEKTLSPHPNPH
jgi:hypothetical protein